MKKKRLDAKKINDQNWNDFNKRLEANEAKIQMLDELKEENKELKKTVEKLEIRISDLELHNKVIGIIIILGDLAYQLQDLIHKKL